MERRKEGKKEEGKMRRRIGRGKEERVGEWRGGNLKKEKNRRKKGKGEWRGDGRERRKPEEAKFIIRRRGIGRRKNEWQKGQEAK